MYDYDSMFNDFFQADMERRARYEHDERGTVEVVGVLTDES